MIVGFELTSHTIRAAAFERGHLAPTPERFKEIPFTPDEDGLPGVECILEAFRAVGGSAEIVALAIPSGWCHYRTVRFPYKSTGRIESTVKFAVEGRVPGAIEQYTVEPLCAPSEDPDGASLLIAAGRTDRLAKLIGRFQDAEVDPAIIIPTPAALASLAREENSQETLLVLRQDSGQIDLAVWEKGRLTAAACIAAFQNDIQEVVAKLKRTLVIWQSAEGVAVPDRVLLMGGDGATEFAHSVEKSLGVPVKRIEIPCAAAAAWGAANEVVRNKSEAASLRRGELAYAPYVERLHWRVAAVLLLAAALLAVLAIVTIRKTSDASARLRETMAEQAGIFLEVTGAPGPITSAALQSALDRERKTAEQQGGEDISCLRRWIALMRLLPKDGDFQFSNLSFDGDSVSLTATAASSSAAYDLNRRINASSDFVNTAPLKVEENLADGRVRFSMELKYP